MEHNNYIFINQNWYGNTYKLRDAIWEALGYKYNIVINLTNGEMFFAKPRCRKKSFLIIEKFDFLDFENSERYVFILPFETQTDTS